MSQVGICRHVDILAVKGLIFAHGEKIYFARINFRARVNFIYYLGINFGARGIFFRKVAILRSFVYDFGLFYHFLEGFCK